MALLKVSLSRYYIVHHVVTLAVHNNAVLRILLSFHVIIFMSLQLPYESSWRHLQQTRGKWVLKNPSLKFKSKIAHSQLSIKWTNVELGTAVDCFIRLELSSKSISWPLVLTLRSLHSAPCLISFTYFSRQRASIQLNLINWSAFVKYRLYVVCEFGSEFLINTSTNESNE